MYTFWLIVASALLAFPLTVVEVDARTVRLTFPESPFYSVKNSFSTDLSTELGRFISPEFWKNLGGIKSCVNEPVFRAMLNTQITQFSQLHESSPELYVPNVSEILGDLEIDHDQISSTIKEFINRLRFRKCSSYANGAVLDAVSLLKHKSGSSFLAITEVVGDIDNAIDNIFTAKRHQQTLNVFSYNKHLFLEPLVYVPHIKTDYHIDAMKFGLRKDETVYINSINQVSTTIKSNGAKYEFAGAAFLESVVQTFSLKEISEVAFQLVKIMTTVWDNSLYYDTTLFKNTLQHCFVVLLYDPTSEYDSYFPRKLVLKGLLGPHCVRKFRDSTDRLQFDFSQLIDFLSENELLKDYIGKYGIMGKLNIIEEKTDYSSELTRNGESWVVSSLNSMFDPSTTWHGLGFESKAYNADSLLTYYNPKIQFLARGNSSYRSFVSSKFISLPFLPRFPPKHIEDLIKLQASQITGGKSDILQQIDDKAAFFIEYAYSSGINVTDIHSRHVPSKVEEGIHSTTDIVTGEPVYYYPSNIRHFVEDLEKKNIARDILTVARLPESEKSIMRPLFIMPSIVDKKIIYYGYRGASDSLGSAPRCLADKLENQYSKALLLGALSAIQRLNVHGFNFIPPVGFKTEGACIFPRDDDGFVYIFPDPAYLNPPVFGFPDLPNIEIRKQRDASKALGISILLTHLRFTVPPAVFERFIPVLKADLDKGILIAEGSSRASGIRNGDLDESTVDTNSFSLSMEFLSLVTTNWAEHQLFNGILDLITNRITLETLTKSAYFHDAQDSDVSTFSSTSHSSYKRRRLNRFDL